jgi:hypothetical protein
MVQYVCHHCLKRQYHEIFDLYFFHQTITSRPLIHALKYFRKSLRIPREINEDVWSRATSYSAGLFFCTESIDEKTEGQKSHDTVSLN